MLVALKTSPAAKDLLLECLGEDGELILGKEFLAEVEKEDLTFPDVLHVLKLGDIVEPADENPKTGEWEYRIEGEGPDGDRLTMVFCFRAINRVFLISLLSVRRS